MRSYYRYLEMRLRLIALVMGQLTPCLQRTNRKRAGGGRQVSIATPTTSAASSRAVTPDSSRGGGSRRASKATPTASAASSRAVSPDSSRPNTPSSPFSRLEDPPRKSLLLDDIKIMLILFILTYFYMPVCCAHIVAL